MTTTTHRTPHALQAGATPASLWLLTNLLAIASTAAALLIPWAAGTGIASESFTPLIWGLLGSVLLISGTQTLLRRAISIRVPGGLRSYTQDELRQMPTIIPNVISCLAQAATILIVGTWSLSHSAEGDHGFTTGMLAMMAGALLLLRLGEGLSPSSAGSHSRSRASPCPHPRHWPPPSSSS